MNTHVGRNACTVWGYRILAHFGGVERQADSWIPFAKPTQVPTRCYKNPELPPKVIGCFKNLWNTFCVESDARYLCSYFNFCICTITNVRKSKICYFKSTSIDINVAILSIVYPCHHWRPCHLLDSNPH